MPTARQPGCPPASDSNRQSWKSCVADTGSCLTVPRRQDAIVVVCHYPLQGPRKPRQRSHSHPALVKFGPVPTSGEPAGRNAHKFPVFLTAKRIRFCAKHGSKQTVLPKTKGRPEWPPRNVRPWRGAGLDLPYPHPAAPAQVQHRDQHQQWQGRINRSIPGPDQTAEQAVAASKRQLRHRRTQRDYYGHRCSRSHIGARVRGPG